MKAASSDNCGLATAVRPASDADSPGVKLLVFSVLRDYGLKPDPGSTDADLNSIETSYLSRGGSFYVIEVDGKLLGSAGLYPIDNSTCELRKMYLHPSFRGRGAGKHLLGLLLADARKFGFSRVTLETASVLREAISLYRSYGFREYTPEHLSPRCDHIGRKKPPAGKAPRLFSAHILSSTQ